MNFILLTFISCLLLFCFICLGIGKFGLLRSYSAYAPKWDETVPMKNLNLWSIITFLAGFLLMPVLLQYSEGHILQFLGFFTPIYLMGVSLTPKSYRVSIVLRTYRVSLITYTYRVSLGPKTYRLSKNSCTLRKRSLLSSFKKSNVLGAFLMISFP